MQRIPILPRLFTLPLLAAGLAICASVPSARAQLAPNKVNIPDTSNPASLIGPHTLAPPPATAKPADVPPPALPGAVSNRDRVAPSNGTVIADPNAALFDAINRGDIASARDALDRGAELESHNILGMTPLDLSVDLGRNDITFLLLSLRNGDLPLGARARGQTATTTQAGNTAPTAKTTPGTKAAPGAKPTLASTRPAAHAPATPPVKQATQIVPAAPLTPRLFANDGGTPNPGAGFLGFGNRP